MNADDYYGMTVSDIVAADTVRELTYQRQAMRAVAARAMLHDVPGDPDRLDECDACECPAVEYVPNGPLDWSDA